MSRVLFFACVCLPAALANAETKSSDIAADRQAANEPFCVAWDKGWVLYRFSMSKREWIRTEVPLHAEAKNARPAVGREAVIALDANARQVDWFDPVKAKWTRAAEPPCAVNWDHVSDLVAGTVGRKLVVWGITRRQPRKSEGAILDFDSMKWQKIPDAPVVQRHRAATAVIGNRLIVWGGYGPPSFENVRDGGPLDDGAVYDVAANKWEKLPALPVKLSTYGIAHAAWRDRFVLFGGVGPKDAMSNVGAIYDPAKGAWDTIPRSPIDIGVQSACAVSGDKLFLWSGSAPGPGAMGQQPTPGGAIYDLTSREWKVIEEEAPIPPRLLSYAKAVGSKVVVWGGWSPNSGEPFWGDGAIFDLENFYWEGIPDCPAEVPKTLHPGW